MKQKLRDTNNTVLVADDELACREAARFFLEHYGLPCDCVCNGLEVLKAHQNNRYSLLLLDLCMDTMSGIEAAKLVRAREQAKGLARLPIVAMTGSEEDLEECLIAGFDEIILKPVHLADFGRILEQFIPGFLAKPILSDVAH